MSAAASSGRDSQRPAIAVLNTRDIATASMLEAAYGRSLTYWPRLKPSPPSGPRRPRTSPTGSTSSSRAAVHRCRSRFGVADVRGPDRQIERLNPARVLVQQEPQVRSRASVSRADTRRAGTRRAGRGRIRCGQPSRRDRQEHDRPSCPIGGANADSIFHFTRFVASTRGRLRQETAHDTPIKPDLEHSDIQSDKSALALPGLPVEGSLQMWRSQAGEIRHLQRLQNGGRPG